VPTVTTGLYKVILQQSYSAQTILNTFWYLHTLGNDDEQDKCAEAFDLTILPVLKTIQAVSLQYVSIRAINVTGTLADFVLTPTTLLGTLTGDPVNTFTAAAIRLNRTTKETRNGQKRFAGMVEIQMNNQVWDAGYVVLLENVATALVANISTVGGIFEPVIARQDAVTPTNWIANPVASATVNSFVTSQVSRKRGIGI